MKKEKDEITDLFRSHLTNAEMTVREGFWEELSQDIPVACQHRRRIIFLRVAAAASVMLVLAASSAALWYLSPKEEIGEAFTQIAVANEGTLDGDGVRMKPLPPPVGHVLAKPSKKPHKTFFQCQEDEETGSVTLSMSFSFSSTSSVNRRSDSNNRRNGFFRMDGEVQENNQEREEQVATSQLGERVKKNRWTLKAQVGTAFPADKSKHKMPLSVGVTVERKLNDILGIETGLLYSNLRSEGQHLHYLGIPIKMNITFIDTKKVDLYATIGGVVDKCIAGAPDNSFVEEPIQLAATGGIGINYKINDRLAVFAEPGVSHHFKTDSKLATIRTKRPTNFNLLCGIRMTY